MAVPSLAAPRDHGLHLPKHPLPLEALWVEPGGVAVQSGLLNERVLLKRPMFITCNKATASNPSRTGNCCCWHGQHGAVRALGREFCVI